MCADCVRARCSTREGSLLPLVLSLLYICAPLLLPFPLPRMCVCVCVPMCVAGVRAAVTVVHTPLTTSLSTAPLSHVFDHFAFLVFLGYVFHCALSLSSFPFGCRVIVDDGCLPRFFFRLPMLFSLLCMYDGARWCSRASAHPLLASCRSPCARPLFPPPPPPLLFLSALYASDFLFLPLVLYICASLVFVRPSCLVRVC